MIRRTKRIAELEVLDTEDEKGDVERDVELLDF